MWSAPQHHLGEMQSLRRVMQIVESRTDADSIRRQPTHQTENLVKSSLRLDVHDPDVQIRLEAPYRIHVPAAQLRFDLWQRLDTHGGNLRGDDDIRTIGRQPQLAGHFTQAPSIDGSPFEHRINENRPLRCLAKELSLLLIAVAGHHDTRDKFGEPADADLGVGRHGAGSRRTDRRQAPHASIDDDRDAHRSADAYLTHLRREVTGDVL